MPTTPAVQLRRGAHRDPEDGMCVMELTSQLARERFTDRPRCVDPVVGAYLRTFNDRVGHRARQALVPYAPRCVGTRGVREVTRARRDLCLAFAGVRVVGRGAAGRALARLGARARIAVWIGVRPALRLCDGAGELAARSAVAARDVDAGFGLLDALLAEGGGPGGARSRGVRAPGCTPRAAGDPPRGRAGRAPAAPSAA